MARNMSFMLTTEQIKNKTKTVTRRLGWDFLKPGDVLNACVKCQGLKKGEKIERLCQIRIVGVDPEPLCEMQVCPIYGAEEATKEGFPDMSGTEFVAMFCTHMKCDRTTVVNRIEFEYLTA